MYCGSLLARQGLLCGECQRHLKSLQTDCSEVRKQRYVLYDWIPQQSDLLSQLILHLKGTRQSSAWSFYGQQFVRKYISIFSGFTKIYIIPAPAKKPQQIDHASLWGRALAKELKADLVPCLKKKSGLKQRGADRGERALIEFEIDEKYTNNVAYSPHALWVFADDIITTGATMRAAHIALGEPKNFFACAFAERRLLAERPRI